MAAGPDTQEGKGRETMMDENITNITEVSNEQREEKTPLE